MPDTGCRLRLRVKLSAASLPEFASDGAWTALRPPSLSLSTVIVSAMMCLGTFDSWAQPSHFNSSPVALNSYRRHRSPDRVLSLTHSLRAFLRVSTLVCVTVPILEAAQLVSNQLRCEDSSSSKATSSAQRCKNFELRQVPRSSAARTGLLGNVFIVSGSP